MIIPWLTIGSGAGFPGVVLAIITKRQKNTLKSKINRKKSKKSKIFKRFNKRTSS